MSNLQNKISIDEYIKNHPDCKQTETVPVMLKGKRELLNVYSIPLEFLYFNIKNGRFKAEYLEEVRRRGGKELDPTDEKDSKRIQTLLLNLDPNSTSQTEEDIKQRGQWQPGIMTDDGFVIDGNRRLSILQKLSSIDKKFNMMKVARLPNSVNKNDLWKLEAGIQLGKDEIVRYGPINELLKLREGIEAGLGPLEIAQTLYGYEDVKEIEKKLDRLKLIENYLEFNGTPQKYSEAKNKVEHFINLQNIMTYLDSYTDDAELKRDVKRAIFGLIQDGRSHLEIRKVREMLKYNSEKALDYLKQIAEISKPRQLQPDLSSESPPDVKSSLDRQVHETIDEKKWTEDDEDDQVESKTEMLWVRAVEALNIEKFKYDIPRLLNAALENLNGIDYTDNQLKTTQCKEIVTKILRHVQQLNKIVEE